MVPYPVAPPHPVWCLCPDCNPRTVVLAEHKWATETLTAEHHPNDHHGMKFTVRVVGGQHHGIEIHCPTEKSALKLFSQILAYRHHDDDHPYLVAV